MRHSYDLIGAGMAGVSAANKCRRVRGVASTMGHESDPLFSQDLDRSWVNCMESKELSLAGSVEVGDHAIAGGFEG